MSCNTLWTFCVVSAVVNKEISVYCQLTFHKIYWEVTTLHAGPCCRISYMNREVSEILTARLLKTSIFNFRRKYRGRQIVLPRHAQEKVKQTRTGRDIEDSTSDRKNSSLRTAKSNWKPGGSQSWQRALYMNWAWLVTNRRWLGHHVCFKFAQQ